MRIQTLDELREEAQISQRLWVKVLGMLQQNWCVIADGPAGSVELVFFDDHGDVFDHLPAANLNAAQASLQANGFAWMREYSSFYQASGVPTLPVSGDREQSRPVYSSGEYWQAPPDRLVSETSRRVSMVRSERTLDRFTEAQDLHWYEVVEEIAAGHKQTHWMWYFFPQLRGLGSSRLAHYFGIADPKEAAEYWDDDLLGGRLRSCTDILLCLPKGTKPEKVFGKIDAMKLRSCMTLFANASSEDERIVEVLARYFHDERCTLTLDIINNSPKARRMYISR
ncbi:MAG: hypothetical protein CFE39_07250 [Comamonadaceae bacterium PBBC2]|nr:MAG: hypothetical protein CFE39_07250 [Comamonadaceae bacterium PBBC2]